MNFAVFSAHATRIELCLFDAWGGHEIVRLDLPDRTDEVFHGLLPAPQGRGGLVYGLRAHGPWRPDEGLLFNPAKLLLDPYATRLRGVCVWNSALLLRTPDGRPDPRDSAPFVPKAVVAAPGPAPEGRGVGGPRVPWDRTVIYEAHVKGLSWQHPGVPPALRGRLAALGEPAVIEHLLRLGVTTLELMPIQAFAPTRWQAERGLTQYWGYSPLSFFAAHPPYVTPAPGAHLARPPTPAARAATESAEEAAEAAALQAEDDALARARGAIRALQQAGIEVILDVVLNHSCEGEETDIALSWRGLDNASYYRRDGDPTGCGNAFHFGHPRVVQMALDALRHWAAVWGVDGFRLDLATTLGRGRDGAFDAEGPFFTALRQDPLLARCKLIAEPWDLGPGGYRLGGFPPGIAEWNDRFRDSVRRFWRGDAGQRGEFATRLAGSADVFDRRGRRPQASITYITAHDGFTLADLVSYARRHNEANGEDNRDGQEEISANWGVEGPTADPAIRALRGRVARAMLATLLLSPGTPMLRAGDEILHSQGGNNNAWCQDNPVSWLDWSRADTPEGAEMLGFLRRLTALRAAHPVLRPNRFQHGAEILPGLPDISWFDLSGRPMTGAAWQEAEGRGLALRRIRRDAEGAEAALLLCNAAAEEAEAMLPDPPLPWRLVLCSATPALPEVALRGPSLPVPGRALRLLLASLPAA